MLIGSLISFGILVLAWMVLPVKATEVGEAAVSAPAMVTHKQTV